ncbi:MAG: Surfactin synthase subunit 2 [Peptostreptococcus russellii]|uniref:Peptide synthetase n=1 Tax=Peptostreptococcus russellii TaxID=215200 RepID=A0A2P7Q1D8_9FIRM|nr:amino acid adenylation domain-containing protein [Peptostreptococcus russellii]PSJ31775.1 peptide synthetase [Peptostreptococcus russellii]
MAKNKHYRLAEKYWTKLLGDYITLARVPNDFLKEDNGKFNMIQKSIKKSMYSEILQYCDDNELSLESVLDTIYGIVLQRFTYEDDVVFGKNNIMTPVRVKTKNPKMKFIDLCKIIMKQTEESKEYDYYMMSQSNYKNALNDKLINTLFIVNILGEPMVKSEQAKKLDMYLKVSVSNGIRLKLMYKSSFYDKRTARSIVYLYRYILKQVISNKDIKLDEIQNMKEEHKENFSHMFDENKFEFDKNISYVSLLKEQVKKTPNNIAISDFDSNISYKEMDELTDKVAAYLNHLGIGEGDTVAVLQQRDKHVVLSAISVLKAGAIFFPIDRTNPDERLGYLLEDGQTKLILTCKSMLPRINKRFPEYNVLSIENEDLIKHNYEVTGKIYPENEAYRISTSGTTGRPKCISIRHDSLMNMCHYSIDYIDANENDKCGVYLSFSFDAIMKQIFPYLLVGASVDILPEYARINEKEVEGYCIRNNVTILALPAIMGKLFMMNCPCKGLRVLQVGGDKFKGYVKRDYKIYNEYGPAEFTVLCTQFHVDKYYELVPVGRPIYNTEAYILDKNNNVCAIGVPGELCLSGIQISNGYLNREDQNKLTFVDNPFAHDSYTQKMYRTGDLAKWIDEDGTIAILGRMDSQIKINGIRIEIFEIENMINMIPEIKNSVVAKREDENGDKYLDAYFVPYEDYYDPDKVRKFLEDNLPPHMIPKNITRLCVLPVTPIGKVDKKALPKV